MSKMGIVIKRLKGFVQWILPNSILSSVILYRLALSVKLFLSLGSSFFKPVAQKDRRLLIIYDLSRQPFTIGDFLVLHVGSLILREEYKADKIDCAVVCEKYHSQPDVPEPFKIKDKGMTYHLASILPVAQVNQYLGSLFLFDSHKHMERFICDNKDMYYVWPSFWKYIQKDEIYRPVNKMVFEYYTEHGRFPYLTCRPFLVDWAYAFFFQHAVSKIPVSINVRNNKWIVSRNSSMEAWLELFDYCLDRYPVKFFVICGFDEVDDRFRMRRNVVVTKDFHTGIEQDLALIHASAFHMGVASGPSAMAIWSPKPYLQISADFISDGHLGIYNATREGNFIRLGFANEHQRFAIPPETPKLLTSEFERMWGTVDFAEWALRMKMVDPQIIEKLSYKR